MKTRFSSGTIAYELPATGKVSDLKILVITKKYKDEWTIPKGGLEPGISREQNAIKECYEEAGVTIQPGWPLGQVSFIKAGYIQDLTMFANMCDPDAASVYPEIGRKSKFVSYTEALKLLDPYMSVFVVRLYDHLKACSVHESRKHG